MADPIEPEIGELERFLNKDLLDLLARANFKEIVETTLRRYKCLEKQENRICSRCLGHGFSTTPAFYRIDDSNAIYLCDKCHDVCRQCDTADCRNGCLRGSWVAQEVYGIPRISEKTVNAISAMEREMKNQEFQAKEGKKLS